MRLCKQLIISVQGGLVRKYCSPSSRQCPSYNNLCKYANQNTVWQKLKGEPLIIIPWMTGFSWPHGQELTEAPFKY